MPTDEFEHWSRCADEDIDLARAALAIARDEYPYLDEAACVARLDAMARAAQAGLGTDADPESVLAVLDRQVLRSSASRATPTRTTTPATATSTTCSSGAPGSRSR